MKGRLLQNADLPLPLRQELLRQFDWSLPAQGKITTFINQKFILKHPVDDVIDESDEEEDEDEEEADQVENVDEDSSEEELEDEDEREDAQVYSLL